MTEVMPLDSPAAFGQAFLGIKAHTTQAQLMDARAKIVVAACGRRWGKTTCYAVKAAHFAYAYPGSSTFVLAPTADQAGILWGAFKTFVLSSPTLRETVIEARESPFPLLRLAAKEADGTLRVSEITCRSTALEAKYTRGHGADLIIVDEAALVSEFVLSQVIPPMLATSPIGELVLASTPFGTQSHFHRLFLQGQEGRPEIVSYHYPSRLNPLVSEEYLAAQRASMTDAAYRTEYEAEFLDETASVFRREVIEAAIDDSLVTVPQPGHTYVIGYDPARFTDKSGVVVLDTTDPECLAVAHVADVGGRDYLLQAVAVRALSERFNEAAVLLDSTSHDMMLSELSRQGVNASGLVFTNEAKRGLVDGLLLAFERHTLRIPRHADLLRELAYYSYQLLPSGSVRLGASTGHDDLVTALSLAIKCAARPGVFRREDILRAMTPGVGMPWLMDGLDEEIEAKEAAQKAWLTSPANWERHRC